MKWSRLAAMVLLLFFAVTATAQNTVSNAADSGSTATVYFLRNTGYNGSAINFHCFVDAELVCNLPNKKYSVHQVTAGKHILIVQTAGREIKPTKKALELETVAGQIYYLKLIPEKSYNLSGDVGLLVVSEASANVILKKVSEEKNCIK